MLKLRPFVCALALCASAAQAQDGTAYFREQVAPILERRCVGCHQGGEAKGGLSLTTRDEALKGGDGGAALEPGKPDDSLLLEMVTGDKPQMPKNGAPLSPEQVATLRKWIADGAAWPKDAALIDRKFEDEWWSLRPLIRPAVPTITENMDVSNPQRKRGLDAGAVNPIDAFVLKTLADKGLTPSEEADRRTLIRRVYFDLIGLPPSPEEIEQFVGDSDPLAFPKLVDRLLDSPEYGERWARHWLDVVHYGETHGYDKDKPRLNAWPYRDYVIRAFNNDTPYSRFIEEQLAGDVLFPNTRDGLEGLGFIAAGPWDFIGHAEVPESKIDGKVARHLDRDDMVANTMQTFNSLTVQCAQCHDHKFDPIKQEDYYSLQAVFAAVDRTDRMYDLEPVVAQRRGVLVAERDALTKQKNELDQVIAKKAGPRLAELDQRITSARQALASAGFPVEFGYHSAIEPKQDAVKWVQIELKQPTPLKEIVLYPCHDDFNGIGAGFGFPLRFRIETADDADFKTNVVIVADRTAEDVVKPGLTAQVFAVSGDKPVRFIRITATKLAPRMNDFICALAEVEARDRDGRNVAVGGVVTAFDSIEAGPRWRKSNLVDGLSPGSKGNPGDVKLLETERAALLEKWTTAQERDALAELTRKLAAVDESLQKLPPQQTAYIGAVHNGSGTFRGTGPDGGKPRPIFILDRGNVTKPGREVGPGAVISIAALKGRFELPASHAEGDRRAALARWLTDPRHPLTWRSIVNRVWHYHFGRGLAATPNDFGRNGQPPTHPELLDWLAVEFRDGGQSFKKLHRLILTSHTWKQSAAGSARSAGLDADNRFLWRMNRRRLDAEAIRDSVLLLAGRLDRSMYGPSFQDFVIDKPEHSPHYEYHLYDPEDPRTHRRSIYRFIVRSQQQPFMTTLDCADPSMQVDRRNESLSALQALTLLNNPFMISMSQNFAHRVETKGDTGQIVDRAFQEALGRPVGPADRKALIEYTQQHGVVNLCRLLLNLNEFAFVE